MLDKLEELYGLRKDVIDAYHAEFHNFKFEKNRSVQENLCLLENIRAKIRSLGENLRALCENVSDSAFKTKLFSVLPSVGNTANYRLPFCIS